MPRLYAVRGATSLDEDSRAQVLSRTQELLSELMSSNGIRPPDLVSILFTATGDLHSEFPAAAARVMGLDGVPLLC
ncbi:MAG TPA: chorismate mutase, partial [Actinomycetota bacterium]|nr:chorismate mutase [Actinomycetota bacterium]